MFRIIIEFVLVLDVMSQFDNYRCFRENITS